tara:strand:+ start:584 stop:1534 length:951 start_codon:yes stop_codon:yes gene_type:complete
MATSVQKISIGFFGTPKFSLSFLKKLHENSFKIEYVVTQPPRPSGRGKKINLSPVHEWAKKFNYTVFFPKNVNDKLFIENIKKIKVDFFVVVAYGQKISRELLIVPKYMCLNVHTSLLPRWRGASPIQSSIKHGDRETGVTIIKMIEKLDAGPIINTKKIEISSNDTSASIENKMSLHGHETLNEAIKDIFSEKFKLTHQNEDFATYAKKISKKDAKIDWQNCASSINRFIRAYNPFPGAWSYVLKKNYRIKIFETEILENHKASNSLKIGQCTPCLSVKCMDKFLKIKKLQPEGKKIMTSEEFVNGHDTDNLILG